jgi:hypothetical protein
VIGVLLKVNLDHVKLFPTECVSFRLGNSILRPLAVVFRRGATFCSIEAEAFEQDAAWNDFQELVIPLIRASVAQITCIRGKGHVLKSSVILCFAKQKRQLYCIPDVRVRHAWPFKNGLNASHYCAIAKKYISEKYTRLPCYCTRIKSDQKRQCLYRHRGNPGVVCTSTWPFEPEHRAQY